MTREILLAVTIAIGVALLVLMIVGWAARRRRDADLPELPPAPAALEDARAFPGKYVATTRAGEPLERVAARGLAFRGPATAFVDERGVLIRRAGERDVWIERAAMRGLGRATWTIDRVVERDGLHVVRWALGERELDTYLRLDEPAAFDAVIAPMRLEEIS